MKLKYYLRGTGIGIVVTTLIFMIAISTHKSDLGTQNPTASDTESKTVAEAGEEKQKDTLPESQDTQAVQPEETEHADSKNEQPKADGSTEDGLVRTGENKTGTSQEPEEAPKAPDQQPDTPKEPEVKKDEKIRIEISGGQYSDIVCQKLQEAGLIDDAKAFNEFLVQKDYDNSILPGVYDIPKDSTYEEIARLLTTKAE